MHKFSSVDAFVAFDLDDAPAVGITRLARKVLVDGAVLLARDTTYAFASFEIERGGGSAGVNADDAARDAAIDAFVTEAAELVSSGRWVTDPGLGVSAEDLKPLYAVDPRPAALWEDGLSVELTVRGARAAAEAALGRDLTAAAVVGAGPVADAARATLSESGITVSGDTLSSGSDAVFVAGKSGVVDHDAAATIDAGVIVPLTPTPLTARAHAVVTQAGQVHVPSFLSTAASLLAGLDGDDPVERVRAVVSELAPSGSAFWMNAAERAEAFLSTWRGEIPTFRPFA